MTRFDHKIEKMRNGKDTRADFIIADAKDADMAAGLSATGIPDKQKKYRTVDQYLLSIESIVKQDIVDIMLTSASILDRVIERNMLHGTGVKSAIRANDTSDLWRGRGMTYNAQPSLPHRTASLKEARADLGLYSMTFNGDSREDCYTLDRFHDFRKEAKAENFSYFLEVFNPNLKNISEDDLPWFMNDAITRALAGLRLDERPTFLKVAYNGPAAFEELCGFDTSMVVGIMGGSSGTTRDCFELLYQSQKYGGRAALFGRKINDSEDPLSMIKAMRMITDGAASPSEATAFYHDCLKKQSITPCRPAEHDTSITQDTLLHAAS